MGDSARVPNHSGAFANAAAPDLSPADLRDDEQPALRAEIDRLHRYIRRQWAAVAAAQSAEAESESRAGAGAGSVGSGPVAAGPISPAAQARAVLRKAQEVADRRLAEAGPHVTRHPRQDAGRLLLLAPARYGDIVVRAHQRAGLAAEAAHDERATPARAELEMKAAYLRTFAKVSRAALQGELEVTAREFEDLLGDVEP